MFTPSAPPDDAGAGAGAAGSVIDFPDSVHFHPEKDDSKSAVSYNLVWSRENLSSRLADISLTDMNLFTGRRSVVSAVVDFAVFGVEVLVGHQGSVFSHVGNTGNAACVVG